MGDSTGNLLPSSAETEERRRVPDMWQGYGGRESSLPANGDPSTSLQEQGLRGQSGRESRLRALLPIYVRAKCACPGHS